MRFTDNPAPPSMARVCHSVQIFSVRVAQVTGGLQWPLQVFGTIALRDSVDRNRNVIFHRKRDNCQILTQEVSAISSWIITIFFLCCCCCCPPVITIFLSTLTCHAFLLTCCWHFHHLISISLPNDLIQSVTIFCNGACEIDGFTLCDQILLLYRNYHGSQECT